MNELQKAKRNELLQQLNVKTAACKEVGASAALLFAALERVKAFYNPFPEENFIVSNDLLMELTGIKKAALQTAFKTLKEKRYIETIYKGVPAQRFFNITYYDNLYKDDPYVNYLRKQTEGLA